MSKRDWFRNTTWNEEIEKQFFIKLSRVRDKGMQAQYLNLQAGELAYTKNIEFMRVAEMLTNKQLDEYSDEILFRSSAFDLLGDIYGFRGDYNKSLDFYKQALDFEAIFPNMLTNSYSKFSVLAIKTGRTDLYDEIEKIFSEERYNDVFPFSKYMKYSILSIISKYKGNYEKAKYYASLAEKYASMKESGFSKHKTLGLVSERDKVLDKLMYE